MTPRTDLRYRVPATAMPAVDLHALRIPVQRQRSTARVRIRRSRAAQRSRTRRGANFRLTARGGAVVLSPLPVRRCVGLRTGAATAKRTRNGRTSGRTCSAFGRRMHEPAECVGAPARAASSSAAPARERPRGDRSCDAAKTTRGLLRVRAVVIGAPVGTVAHVRRDPLLDDLDARQRAAVTSTAHAARDPRAGRLRARRACSRAASRTASARARPTRATCSRSRSPARPPASSSTGSARSASTARHRRHVPRARARAAAPARGRARPRAAHACSTARRASSRRSLGAARARGHAAAVADVATEIEWAKARLIAPERVRRRGARGRAAATRAPRAELADLYARYEAEKRTRPLPRLRRPARSVRRRDRATTPTFAAAQRWRFRHLFVDEFQDATPLQLRLLRGVARRPDRPRASSATPRRRSTASPAPTRRRSPTSRATSPAARTIALDRNYRSTPQVVAVAEAALGPRRGRRPRPPDAVRPDGAGARRSLAYDDDDAEATAVADGCWHAFTAGVPWHRDGCAVPHQRAVVAVRGRAHPPRHPVPRRRRRSASSSGPPSARCSTGCARPNARRAGRAVRRAPRRPRRRRRRRPGRPTRTRRGRDDELRAHRDALLAPRPRLPRGRRRRGQRRRLRRLARPRDPQRAARPGAAVDLRDVPPRQGPRVAVVFVTGLERGLVPISWATDAGGRRRGTAAAARRARPGRGRAALLVGPATDGRTAAGAAREPSPWLAALAGHGPGSPRPTPVDPRERSRRPFAPRWTRRRRRNRCRAAAAAPVDGLATRGDHGEPDPVREVAMARTTLPLFPTDDGWPYPDADRRAGTTSTTPSPTSTRSSSAPTRTRSTRSPPRSARPCVQRFGLDGCVPVSMQAARRPSSAAPGPKPASCSAPASTSCAHACTAPDRDSHHRSARGGTVRAMHRYDERTERIADAVFAYTEARLATRPGAARPRRSRPPS